MQFASALLDTLLVIFLSLYELVVAPSFRDFVGSLVPVERRTPVEQVMAHMAEAMGGYVRGAFIDAVLVGILLRIVAPATRRWLGATDAETQPAE